MDKQGLLKSIAESGYNAGFGAKKNFATHDIVQKAPGFATFISLTIGVFALFLEALNAKWIAASLILLAVTTIYVGFYDDAKESYAKEGARLTKIFTRLRDLYREVEGAKDGDDMAAFQSRLEALDGERLKTSLARQILFSDWYAHYKFFWQNQIEWVDDQEKFGILRDKVPLTLSLPVAILVACGLIVIVLRLLHPGWPLGC